MYLQFISLPTNYDISAKSCRQQIAAAHSGTACSHPVNETIHIFQQSHP